MLDNKFRVEIVKYLYYSKHDTEQPFNTLKEAQEFGKNYDKNLYHSLYLSRNGDCLRWDNGEKIIYGKMGSSYGVPENPNDSYANCLTGNITVPSPEYQKTTPKDYDQSLFL
jgi:hypothetical protein